jgi:hypothetical protein
MEARHSSETSFLTRDTARHIAENSIILITYYIRSFLTIELKVNVIQFYGRVISIETSGD